MKTALTTTILILFTHFCFAQNFWIELERPTGGMVFSLAVNSITEVYAGMGNGVYLSNDDSKSWILTGLEGITSYSLHIHQNGNIFAGTGGSHNIYRLKNLDEGWEPIFSGSANIISITSNSLGDIFAGSGHDNGLLRSNNNGDDWEQLLTLSSSEQTNAIISLSTNMVFIGTTDFMGGGGVYRSADNGDTWEQIGLPNKYIRSLAVNSQGDIFAGSVGDHYLYYGGLYKSTDNGETWVELRNDVLVTSIVITPDDHIYFGSNEYGDQAGVFFSNDHGETWERIISGLIGPSNQKIEGLSLAPDGYLYAYGNHLHRSAEPVYPGNTIQQPDDFHTTIYPNPFEDYLHIAFEQPLVSGRFFSLKVFDLAGILVFIQSCPINPINLSFLKPGLYYISIELNGQRITHKIVKQ
jgi:hypothetical protein